MGARTPIKKPTSDEALGEAVSALRETLAELRISQSNAESLLQVEAYAIARAWLSHLFPDGKTLLAYVLSDGKRSTRDIGKHVGVDQKTISTWWRTWQREYHIVEKAGNRGQFKAKFTIAHLLAIHGKPPAPSSSA